MVPIMRARLFSKTHYEVLQVAASATPEEIRRAFRMHAKRAHPDLCAASKTDFARQHDAFVELHSAYEVLSDPCRRAHYDLELMKRRRISARIRAAAWEVPALQRVALAAARVGASVRRVAGASRLKLIGLVRQRGACVPDGVGGRSAEPGAVMRFSPADVGAGELVRLGEADWAGPNSVLRASLERLAQKNISVRAVALARLEFPQLSRPAKLLIGIEDAADSDGIGAELFDELRLVVQMCAVAEPCVCMKINRQPFSEALLAPPFVIFQRHRGERSAA